MCADQLIARILNAQSASAVEVGCTEKCVVPKENGLAYIRAMNPDLDGRPAEPWHIPVLAQWPIRCIIMNHSDSAPWDRQPYLTVYSDPVYLLMNLSGLLLILVAS